MNELIQQARELCEKAETEFWYVKDSRWHCGKPILTQLCDALEAETARAEAAEAERDACKVDMRLYNDNLCETCKVENCGMRSSPPLSRTTICFKHEWRGAKGE